MSKEENRIIALEVNQKNIMDKLEEFQKDNKEQHQELKNMIEKALEQKANVWVEKALTWLLYTVAGIIVTALVYLVINK